jgi:uncharacterized protein YqgC (DUF456 family)
MLNVIVCILGSILIILGLFGCIVPALPGPPLSFIALLILAIAQGFVPPLTSKLILIMLMVTIVITMLDYVIPAAGAKKYGSSKWGIWGAILGMIIGIIYFPPLGMIVGAFIGAVAVEMLVGKSSREALKAGWGVFMGTLFGTILKLIASGVMTYYFVWALI